MKPSLSPTIRIVNGKPVSFYSPAQIEAIIPPTERMPASAHDGLPYTEFMNHRTNSTTSVGLKKPAYKLSAK